MRSLYLGLMRLYPVAYRQLFSKEMFTVFEDLRADISDKGVYSRFTFFFRELTGLTIGAVKEHLRVLTGHDSSVSISPGRFSMRSGFRFPKTTAVLMTIILAGVLMAIKMGEDIAGSLPHDGGQVAPIHPVHHTLISGATMILLPFYAIGLACWAILFALRKSGVHRFMKTSDSTK